MFQVLIFSLVMGYAVGQSMDGGNGTDIMPMPDATNMTMDGGNGTDIMPMPDTTNMTMEENTTDTTMAPPSTPPPTEPGPCNQTSDCPQDQCCYFLSRHRHRDGRHPHFGWGHKWGHRSGVCRRYQESGQRCPRGCGCAPGLECVYPNRPWNFRLFNFRGRFGRRRGTCRSE